MPSLGKLLLPAIVLVAACSGGLAKREGPPLRYEDYAGAPIESFRINNLDGWQSMSRDQLLVWNGPSEAYLITVWNTCNNLNFATVVDLSSTSREISRLEQVTVDGMRCPISVIRPVDMKAMREDQQARAADKQSAP